MAVRDRAQLLPHGDRRPAGGGRPALEDRMPALGGLSEEVHQREDCASCSRASVACPRTSARRCCWPSSTICPSRRSPHRGVRGEQGQGADLSGAQCPDRRPQRTEPPCEDIREQLAVARGGELRRGPLRRHLKLCVGCRDFQLALSAQRQSLAAVLPVLPSAGLAAAILGHGAAPRSERRASVERVPAGRVWERAQPSGRGSSRSGQRRAPSAAARARGPEAVRASARSSAVG